MATLDQATQFLDPQRLRQYRFCPERSSRGVSGPSAEALNNVYPRTRGLPAAVRVAGPLADITIALGSVLATILLNSATSLSEGLTALWLLVTLQFGAAVTTSRISWLRRAVTAGPTVLYVDGVPQLKAMRRHRVGMDELVQSVRSTGTGDLSLVAAVVLETDGTLSVIDATGIGDGSALPGRGSSRVNG